MLDTLSLHRRQVRPALCSLVRQHIKDSRDAGKLDDAFLEELPRALRNEVLRDINMRVIGKAPIFASCNRKCDVNSVGSMSARILGCGSAEQHD